MVATALQLWIYVLSYTNIFPIYVIKLYSERVKGCRFILIKHITILQNLDIF